MGQDRGRSGTNTEERCNQNRKAVQRSREALAFYPTQFKRQNGAVLRGQGTVMVRRSILLGDLLAII